ncbi:hypothetical protein MVEN_02245000 [Mycena venus]|uniref:Uncharacterized protein n=1 Tax=Mycena venus TaxID=2733690 RepID=A0A8H6X6L3_9AGAR|nr:hypothetical protein MVEN_02245000 [Mycena venus]
MASFSNTVPLTSRHLQQEDRARLIRSTRKIEGMMGETPQVVDVSSFAPPPHPGSTKIKRVRQKLSPTLSETVPAPHRSDTRPVLYLRVPDAPPPDRGLPTPTPSPTLTVALNLRHSAKKENATRRRRMAKLCRTLGANVPANLVFPPENLNDPRYRRLTSRTLQPPGSPVATSDLRSRNRESKRMSTVSGASSRSGRTRTQRESDADSISRGWVWVGKRDDLPRDVLARIKRTRKESGLPFQWVPMHTGRLQDVEEEEGTAMPVTFRALRRKEEGWSGEWAGSAQNMDQVVERLRGLKVK